MAVVRFSPSRSGSQDALQPFERLALSVSACMCASDADDAEDGVARGLEEIGTTFGVDECTFIAYGERGSVRVVRSWAAPPHAPCTDEDIGSMPWLLQRLARNAVVAMTPTTDCPACRGP